ncbi:MAG: lipase maturation factor family protein [Methylacidiphilales bacterium]|nr:lipase maturation factor family protein [Candidatus Methylacidiphilales bacterium]
MEPDPPPAKSPSLPDTYWLTRFVLLRLMGFIYLIAFYVAAQQLVPLVGANGLTPASLFFQRVAASPDYGGTFAGFLAFPSLFWWNYSDACLHIVPWIGVVISCVVLAGYANALMMAVLWFFYVSIVHAGQEWYGYGWEIQMSETGFLCIFLCPLLDARPFSLRPPPLQVIFLFRWLIVRIMLGSALIKLRGDSCWRDLTALYYHFETQPIPNPISRWFHFLPHPILKFGVIWTFVVELGAPWFAFWPRWGRTIAGVLIVSFQLTLIVSGNLSFFNWLTILPALACFDDRFWRKLVPTYLTSCAVEAQVAARPSRVMNGTAWAVTALVALLSIQPVLNLLSPEQAMNTSYDPLNLVNTYGAFGSVGRERPVIIFEGTDSADPDTATDWKEYPYVASPWDPKLTPRFIAPYQPHLDWQLWFAAMATYHEYPWTLNLVWKLLHNDPAALSLFAGNPFPDHPPRYIRAVLYIYHFAKPGNPDHLYWNRERVGLWLPPLSVDDPELRDVLKQAGWLN